MKITAGFILLGLAFAGNLRAADDKWDISKYDLSKLPPASTKTNLTYAKDIHSLFEKSCFRCHGADRQKGDLRLDTLEAVLKGGEDGKVVVANNSKASLLVAAAAQVSDEIAMPPKHRGGHGPGGPGGGPDHKDSPPPGGGPDGQPGPEGPPPGAPPGPPPNGGDDHPPGGPGNGRGPGGPGGKPFTAEQVGLIRAWIDQGAK